MNVFASAKISAKSNWRCISSVGGGGGGARPGGAGRIGTLRSSSASTSCWYCSLVIAMLGVIVVGFYEPFCFNFIEH